MKPQEHTFTVLHTNDIHSRFELMPRIGAALEALRRERDPSEVLVIDCGDHMDRVRPETEGSQGLANIAVLNETGYDLVVPGNNEGLTFTPEQLREAYAGRRGYEVVCANLLMRQTGAPPDWMIPYRIFTKCGIRIGVFGLTACYPDFYSLLGWDVLDPYETAARVAGELRPQVEVLLLVSHLGLKHDKAMAERVPGIDVILGAHTHHLLEEPLQIGQTYIAAAGCFGRYVGQLTFAYDRDYQTLRLEQGKVWETEGFAPSPRVERVIREAAVQSEKTLGQAAAFLEQALTSRWDRESELGNLLAAGVRQWVDADCGIVNAGQILDGLPSGTVTWGRLLEICPSPINPCKIRLKGEHLLLALEESLLPEFTDMAIKGFGFRGKRLGALCVDGVEVHYNAEGEPYRKITRALIQGEQLDPERLYAVGTLDMFTFGTGYMSLSRGDRVEYFLPEFIRDVLARQLQLRRELERCAEPRWLAD